MRGGAAGGGLPGSDFVVQAFEDGLRALAEQGEEQGQGGRGRQQREQQEQDQFEMLTRLAEAYLLNGEPEQAQHYLRRAYALDPRRFEEDEDLLARLGEAQHRQGRLQEAQKSYRQALAQNEENSRAALRLGVSLHDQGDAVSACNYYYRAIQLDGRNKAAYNNLGVALQELGQLDPALQSYKKARGSVVSMHMHTSHPPPPIPSPTPNPNSPFTFPFPIPPQIQALEIDGLYPPALQNLAALTVAQGRFKLALGTYVSSETPLDRPRCRWPHAINQPTNTPPKNNTTQPVSNARCSSTPRTPPPTAWRPR